MERIILGLDDDEASQTALDWVVARSAGHRVSVGVVSVAWTKRGARTLHAIAGRAVERLRTAHPGTAATEIAVTDGSSIPEALAAASAGADLLVIAHHRSRRVRAGLAGWLPLEVVAEAPCPVVVVPDDWHRRSGRVVVAVMADGSSDSALAFAAAEAGREDAVLELVDVETEYVSVGARRRIDAQVASVRAAYPALAVHAAVTSEDRDDALIAAGEGAALMVIGSHRRSAVESVLVGSALHRLMRANPTPVCVVPAGAPA